MLVPFILNFRGVVLCRNFFTQINNVFNHGGHGGALSGIFLIYNSFDAIFHQRDVEV